MASGIGVMERVKLFERSHLMVEKEEKYFVEIYSFRGECITFDLGNFAIIVERDPASGKDIISSFSGKAYLKKFISDWGNIILDEHFRDSVKSVVISPREAERIRETFKKYGEDFFVIWRLLKEIFPQQIEDYKGMH